MKNRNFIPFMDHLNIYDSTDRKKNAFRIGSTVHIFILFVVGVLLSNLILLPIYKLQVAFPGLFGLLIVFALLGLAVFYVNAYMKVSPSDTPLPVFSGITFLGYRMMNNTLFILKILSIVLLVVISVIFLADINIGFLESIQLLEKREGFQ